MNLNEKAIYSKIKLKGLKVGHLIDNSGVSRKSFYDYLHNKIKAPDEFIIKLANNLSSSIKEITQ